MDNCPGPAFELARCPITRNKWFGLNIKFKHIFIFLTSIVTFNDKTYYVQTLASFSKNISDLIKSLVNNNGKNPYKKP